MNIDLKPAPAADRTQYSKLLIGVAECPACKATNVRVFNPHGAEGNSAENFFEEHTANHGDQRCRASKKSFGELVQTNTLETSLPVAKKIFHHDDSPCNARLTTRDDGRFCPECNFHPDMQSLQIKWYCTECDIPLDQMKCPRCHQEFTTPK